MTTTHTATLDCFGDILQVEWTGSVWRAPTTGSQHSRRREAMALELYLYLASCGEDVQIDDLGEFEGLLDNIEE